MNDYFDQIYCLNLDRRSDRMEVARKRFEFVDLRVERFNAIDGQVVKPLWRSAERPLFKNPSYLACALSHLSMYQQALDRGCERLLVVEDDVRVHRNLSTLAPEVLSNLPDDWDLVHFAFIPLSDDLLHWDYRQLSAQKAPEPGLYKSKNLWSLMAYGISARLMKHLLQVYADSFPMELDRYFVTNVMNDPRFVCRATIRQLFCAEDNHSDNTDTYTPGLLQKSVDLRVSKYHDYI